MIIMCDYIVGFGFLQLSSPALGLFLYKPPWRCYPLYFTHIVQLYVAKLQYPEGHSIGGVSTFRLHTFAGTIYWLSQSAQSHLILVVILIDEVSFPYTSSSKPSCFFFLMICFSLQNHLISILKSEAERNNETTSGASPDLGASPRLPLKDADGLFASTSTTST